MDCRNAQTDERADRQGDVDSAVKPHNREIKSAADRIGILADGYIKQELSRCSSGSDTNLAFACLSILSAVIAAKVIVSEYCGKNVVILLSYPVNRKAMLETKCLIVSSITAAFAFISNVLVIGIMYISAHIFGIMPQMDIEHFVFAVLFSRLFMGILTSAVGIIWVMLAMSACLAAIANFIYHVLANGIEKMEV